MRVIRLGATPTDVTWVQNADVEIGVTAAGVLLRRYVAGPPEARPPELDGLALVPWVTLSALANRVRVPGALASLSTYAPIRFLGCDTFTGHEWSLLLGPLAHISLPELLRLLHAPRHAIELAAALMPPVMTPPLTHPKQHGG